MVSLELTSTRASAVSGCPGFGGRLKLVQSRRDRSLRLIWQCPSSDDFALTFVIRGLLGDDAIPPSLDDCVTQAQVTSAIMVSRFINPVSSSSLSSITLRRFLEDSVV